MTEEEKKKKKKKEEETLAEETVTEQVKTEETFTQEDVNKIVKSRIAREKDSAQRVQEAFDSFRKETDVEIEKYESHIKLQVDNLSASIPDNVKSILGKLPVLDQLEWLTDPKNQIESRKSPITPAASPDANVDEKEKIKPLF